MKKIFIFLFVISVMICCIGCGKKATYKETTKTSDETVDLQGRDSEIEQLSQQVADLKIAVKDMQDIVNGTIAKVENSNSSSQQRGSQNEQENSYEQYVNLKFQKDGKTYSVRKDNKVKFYSDVYCTQEITEIPDFISSNADSGKAPNGLNVYAVWTVNDEIIYSSQKPIIVEKE